MNVEKLILQVRKDNAILERKKEELERLLSICHVTGINLEAERVSGSRDNSSKEHSYLSYINYKQELEDYIAQTIGNRRTLMKLIDKLDDTKAIEVLYRYCFKNEYLSAIANDMNYSKDNIYKIYRKAIKRMELYNSK